MGKLLSEDLKKLLSSIKKDSRIVVPSSVVCVKDSQGVLRDVKKETFNAAKLKVWNIRGA